MEKYWKIIYFNYWLIAATCFNAFAVAINQTLTKFKLPCSPRNSQESSPAPQLESISSLMPNLLYDPTLNSYMTTGKTIALTRQTFVGKVMSLLFNMLFRLIIAFLPKGKCLLISWLQSPSGVIFGASQKCNLCFPIYLPWNYETRCHNLSFLNVEF